MAVGLRDNENRFKNYMYIIYKIGYDVLIVYTKVKNCNCFFLKV